MRNRKVRREKSKTIIPTRNLDSGWSKRLPAYERRRLMLKAHKRDLLSSARAMQALANKTQDKQTAIAARADAQYFYREYRHDKK